ncbi:MAG: hypothetical protein EBU32_08630 [Opitutaceae bacterium]|nr:hypothetical protein [Opitutaceae bacterium]
MNITPNLRCCRARLSIIAALFLNLAFALCSVHANAPATPTPAEPTPPPTAAYTNQPIYNERVEYYPNYNSSNYNSGFSNPSFSTTSHYYAPLATFIFFPPTPPPLGGPILLFRRYGLSQPETQLPQLLPYVGEPFYAPLSAHLHREDLSKKQRTRLDAYQATRSAQLIELHAKLTAVRDAEPTARARTLQEFATQQTPILAALEIEAEAFRENLVNGSFFQSGADWNDNRTWALGDDLRYESRIDEFKVIRASAFFAAGLSPAQRRLLRELAMELDQPLTEPTADLSLDAPKPYFFFTPETARIRLPDDLSPEITAKIDGYQAAKTQLKSTLRNAIYKNDRAFFSFNRTKAFRALAEEQAPALAQIEIHPRASRPAVPIISESLNNRIASFLREKQSLQRTLVEKFAAIKAAFPENRVEYIRLGDSYGIEIVSNRRSSRAEEVKVTALRAELVPFNADQSRRVAALNREKDVIQKSLLEVAKTKLKADATAADVDGLIKHFAQKFAEQEGWQRYRDYDTAVFEPGLSPEQRRLLFADALAQLDLPLPRGSRDP